MRNRPRLLDLDLGLGTDNGLGQKSRTCASMVGGEQRAFWRTRLLQIDVSQEEGSSSSLLGSILRPLACLFNSPSGFNAEIV